VSAGLGVLLALWAQSARAEDEHVRRTESGHLLVRATVAGGEGWFVLDTAASSSLLSPGFAEEVLADREPWRHAPVAGVGGVVEAPVYRPIEVVVHDGEGAHVRTLDYAVVLAIPHLRGTVGDEVRGILGLDLLRSGAVQIDPAAPAVDWSVDPPPKRSARKLGTAPGKLLTTLLAVQAAPRSDAPIATVRGVLDLGSPVTIVNPIAAASLSLEPVAPLDPDDSAFSGADGHSVEGLEARDLQCEIVGSRAVVQPCTLVVADAPVFRSLSMHEGPSAVVGADMIGRPFVLDARRRLIWWR
jgi:hypothetical protein